MQWSRIYFLSIDNDYNKKKLRFDFTSFTGNVLNFNVNMNNTSIKKFYDKNIGFCVDVFNMDLTLSQNVVLSYYMDW